MTQTDLSGEIIQFERRNSASSARLAQDVNLSSLLDATGQAFYVWDLGNDHIEWSDNLVGLLNLSKDQQWFLTGNEYEARICGDGVQSRQNVFDALAAELKNQIPSPEIASQDHAACSPRAYECVYGLALAADQPENPLWVEDAGIVHFDNKANPIRAEGSIRIVTERRNREEFLLRRADIDCVTGLPNRNQLEKRLTETIAKRRQDSKNAAFAIIALERLDLINKLYGFDIGDYILKHCGQLLKTKLRRSDLITRLSGTKYGIVFDECKISEIYDAIGRMIKTITSQIIETPKGFVSTSAHAGVCFLPAHADTPSKVFQTAYIGLTEAKLEHNGKIGIYSPDPEADAKARESAEYSKIIINSLRDNRLKLAYQPIVNNQGEIEFHEALARLMGENDEIIPAAKFIPICEHLGLTRIVDKRVLELALITLRQYPDAILAINIAHDSVNNPDWISMLSSACAADASLAGRLIIEITESMAITDMDETRRFINNVKGMGCRVAIDDFGAGFTSFSHLKNLPIDMVKIDGLFGDNFDTHPENEVFIKALVSLARYFKLQTVVEWVEREDTALKLASWNVDYFQGRLFGMPELNEPWTEAKTAVNSDEPPLAPAEEIKAICETPSSNPTVSSHSTEHWERLMAVSLTE